MRTFSVSTRRDRRWILGVAAAALAVSLIAAGCGSDEPAQSAVSEPEPGTEQPSELRSVPSENELRDLPEPATPSRSSTAGGGPVVTFPRELPAVQEPSAEIAVQVIAAADAAAPELDMTLGQCTEWLENPAIVLSETQADQCAAKLLAAVDACEELVCFPENSVATPQTGAGQTSSTETSASGSATYEPTVAKVRLAVWAEYETWVPPYAGLVPAVHPDTPTPGWLRADFVFDKRQMEMPRQTALVIGWTEACNAAYAWCDIYLRLAYQAIDYLGAHPVCVLNQYTYLVQFFADGGRTSDTLRERLGWHNCATVIDPLVQAPSSVDEYFNDTGRRLSDTGLSVAELCRAVLPSDVQLETQQTRRGIPVQRFAAGVAGCDGWATFVESTNLYRTRPGCAASAHLAAEWMEHHHQQHERYFKPWC